MAHQPLEIAWFFLKRSEELPEEGLNSMKLNKMVFLAHGWTLGIHGNLLLDENVEAWPYGPIIRSLYFHFIEYGKGIIPYFDNEALPEDEFTKKEHAVLNSIWKAYKDWTGPSLSELTHKPQSPWWKTWYLWGGNKRRGTIISNSEIKFYYSKQYELGKNRLAKKKRLTTA